MFREFEIRQFLDELSSEQSAPGGGAAAALAGAMGASLIGMVCRLTIGKPGYEQLEKEIEAILTVADELKRELLLLMGEDARVFRELMATFRLPKNTEAEKEFRKAEILAKSEAAAEIPSLVAKACVTVMELAARAAGQTNPNLNSDIEVSLNMAVAGMRSAIVNIKINLPGIKNQAKIDTYQQLIEAFLEREEICTRRVQERLA